MSSISNSKTFKDKRESFKKLILKLVIDNYKNTRTTGGIEIIEFCEEKEIGKTLARKMIDELERDEKLHCIDTKNNEKHYYPTEKLRIPKGSYIIAGEVGELEILDKQLKKVEKIYCKISLIAKIVLIHGTLETIFGLIKKSILFQSLGNSDNIRKSTLASCQKLIRRLYQITDNPSDPDRIKITGIFPLLGLSTKEDLIEYVKRDFLKTHDITKKELDSLILDLQKMKSSLQFDPNDISR